MEAEARRELEDILEACRAVEERRMDPFLLDVSHALRTLRRHFPTWRSVEDLCLDARVLNAISRVLQLQEARLRYEAGLFFADPESLVQKVRRTPSRDLAALFLQAWHPVVELEQVTEGLLEMAKRYWDEMQPPGEETVGPLEEPAEIGEEELARIGILSKEGFLRELGELWEELRARGPVDYWSFVRREDFTEMVRRAYGVSFLVSYGYAEVNGANGSWTLRANDSRRSRRGAVSVPVALSRREGDG